MGLHKSRYLRTRQGVGSGGGGGEVGPRIEGLFFFFGGLLWAKEAAFFLFFPLCGLLQRRENKAEEREGNKRDRRGGHSSGRALIAVGTMSLDDDVITSANPTPPKTL